MTHSKRLFTAIALGVVTAFTQAQTTSTAAADPWIYKTKRLDRDAVDALLAQPQKLLVVDLRRPDELGPNGSFPVYLSVQANAVEQALPFISKDRVILTVSNHAHRAGAAGDLLTSRGFKVAGAAGSQDYEAQGGKAVVHVLPPVKPASAVTAP